MRELRDLSLENDCHAWLEERFTAGRELHSGSDFMDLPTEAEWVRIYRDVMQHHVAVTAAGKPSGRAAVLSAGPPGAGKCTAVAAADLHGYRRFDPDAIRDDLLVSLDRMGYLSSVEN